MKKLLLSCVLFFIQQAVLAEDLTSIYQQALNADPQLKSALMQVNIGNAQQGQAGGELLPQITAGVNLSLNDRDSKGFGSDSYKGQRYNVYLKQSVVDMQKYWNWQRAKNVTEQYTLESQSAEQELMLKVIEGYFNVLEAEDEFYLLSREQETSEKQLEQIQMLFKKQEVRITELYEVEARLDKIIADKVEAENRITLTKERLRELTGENIGKLFVLKKDIDYKALQGDLETWVKTAKTQNPALIAQLKAIEAANNDVAQQKSGHLPVVDLQLSYLRSDTGFDNSARPETDTQTAALNVTIPLFSGGITSERVAEAGYRLEMQKLEQEIRMREIDRKTRDAFLNTNSSYRQIQAYQKALISTNKAREALEKGFKYGVESVGDVLFAQAAEFRAKRDLAKARYGYIRHWMQFIQAIGEINEDNINEINQWLQPS